jgi:DNA-binding CsgD family transcriptional regulator
MHGDELDLLPDEVNWRDEGCEVFGSCLNCPLPRCVEEEPRGQQRLRLAVRDRRMAELRRSGKGVKEIAGLFGVSRRTVERALKNQKLKIEMSDKNAESTLNLTLSYRGRGKNF